MPKPKSRIVSLDTETTGTDHFHGAKPFFVTTCDESGIQRFWEADVNPLTREPQWTAEDIEEIGMATDGELDKPIQLVLQNAKFDFHALKTISLYNYNWDLVQDTLIAGHLLASNHPHNLTDMALEYLGVDIKPYEDALEVAVKEARKIAKREFKNWRIAKKDDPQMPSAKEKTWKYDSWLPKAIFDYFDSSNQIPKSFETVLRDYANADSAVTIQLWQAMEAELHRRGLWELYLERMKLVPIAWRMEEQGVTVNRKQLEALKVSYQDESDKCGMVCTSIASTYMVPDQANPLFGVVPFPLEMPKGGRNDSLAEFCFKVMQLPIMSRTEKGAPSLDKHTLEAWTVVLEQRSKELRFIEALRHKRKYDSALSYLASYEKFWLQLPPAECKVCDGTGRNVMSPCSCSLRMNSWMLLHPNLNQTGTDTLRWSCNNPNAQQVGKPDDVYGVNLRSVFGPTPGREWWKCDAKNIELRLPAYESGEPNLIALFERPNDPPFYGSQHLLNFSIVYADIWAAAVKEVGIDKAGPYCKKRYEASWYQYCKNGDFALQYQCGEATADKAFHRPGAFRLLKSKFDKLDALNRKWVRFADKHGYVETMPDKSVDPTKGYPLLCTRSEYGGIVSTTPLNYRVQGTACWWMGRAMVRCQEQLDAWQRESRFDGRIVLQVHDELVFDFPQWGDPVKEASGSAGKFRISNLWRARTLRDLMAKGGEDIGVPTPTSLTYCPSGWDQGIDL